MSDVADEEKQAWFSACSKADTKKIYQMMDAGFDPDTRDAQGNSGLTYAARCAKNHHRVWTIDTLINGLRWKYIDNPDAIKDPDAFYKALTDGEPEKLLLGNCTYTNVAKGILTRTIQKAYHQVLMNGAHTHNPELWMAACEANNTEAIQAYLDAGFNPDPHKSEGEMSRSSDTIHNDDAPKDRPTQRQWTTTTTTTRNYNGLRL